MLDHAGGWCEILVYSVESRGGILSYSFHKNDEAGDIVF